jgi:muramoyltetrapeptide carboxypeptidase
MPENITALHSKIKEHALFDFPDGLTILRHPYYGHHMKTLKPRALKHGDVIGLISPASKIADTTRLDRGIRYLEGLGYRVLIGAHATQLHGYLAGTDQERAADIHAMFQNPVVKAIFCIRGGYGTPRLLPLLHYRTFARNPKIFVGYSDITALHLSIWKKSGLLTFHGPMVGPDMADPMDPFTEEMFWRLLTSKHKVGLVNLPDNRPDPLVEGKASGHLLGGNLALVASLIGTSFQPRFDGSILYLEDIGEDPYRVDRMLTQLRGASVLAGSKGILIGHFTDCVPKDPTTPSFSVDEVIREYVVASGHPTLTRVPFGHQRRNLSIPVGLRAKIDAGKGSIEYLEAAVH